MMGQYIHDSTVINKMYNCHYINLATAADMLDIGKIGLKKIKKFAYLLLNIRSLIKALRPDLIYVTPNACGGAFYKDFIVVQMLKTMGCKVVAHYHNKGVSTRQDRLIDNVLYRQFFRNLKLILVSERLYGDIKKYVDKEDVFICPNGLPNEETHSMPATCIVNSLTQLLFLSNMMKAKGVYDLLEACLILKNKNLSFQCHFVGKWADITEQEFAQILADKDLTETVFAHGPKYGKEKESFFRQADVFVFPTYYGNEIFGLVNLEAMQYALPVISTNEGAIPDIIDDGITGYIVAKRNPLMLADRIEVLLDKPTLRKEMGQAGKKKFEEQYSFDIFEKRMCEILNSI